MDYACNQGKDDYSDIQDRALGVCPLFDMQVNRVCSALIQYNIIFLLEYSSV